MYPTILLSVFQPVATDLPSISSRRLTSTATRQRSTRTWKSSAVRLSLAIGTLYCFNTNHIFAEAVSQAIPTQFHPGDEHYKDPIPQKQRHIEANTETTHENYPESIESPQPQSGAQNSKATDDASDPKDKGQQGAFNPETGEFNWDCSYLGGMAHGPCREKSKSAFSCFMLSTNDPKGMDCIDQFKAMQEFFKKYPDVYGGELADDAEADP